VVEIHDHNVVATRVQRLGDRLAEALRAGQ
jgi:hypothetical protein